MNTLVLCDLDGTLIDSRRDLAAGVNLMRKHCGLPPLAVETVTKLIGNGVRVLVRRALPEMKDADMGEVFAFFRKSYRENMFRSTVLYPTVLEGLSKISRKGCRIGLTSNKPEDACREILEHFEISKFFSIILGGESAHPLKPDPASLIAALRETNSLPKKSWIIGDNYTDLEAGRRAGMKRCFARYGFGDIKDEKFDLAVESFAEFAEQV